MSEGVKSGGNAETAESKFTASEAIKKLAPDFHEMSLDMQDVLVHSKDPSFMAALMFKLMQEREKTNQMLAQINEKYDRLMFEMKTKSAPEANPEAQATSNLFQVLPEQDQMIMNLVDQKGSVDANGVKQLLGYKGTNAACQRLNKLHREGQLKKIQSGKKVLFLAVHV